MPLLGTHPREPKSEFAPKPVHERPQQRDSEQLKRGNSPAVHPHTGVSPGHGKERALTPLQSGRTLGAGRAARDGRRPPAWGSTGAPHPERARPGGQSG